MKSVAYYFMEETGFVRYGELRLHFYVTEEADQFMQEHEINREVFMIGSQSFYQGVLFKLGIGHKEEKEVEVVFCGMKKGEDVMSGVLSDEYVMLDSFPLQDYFVDFGVRVL